MAYVDADAIPVASNEYVCWLDIMGTKSKMENSVKTCSIFIFQLHTAVLKAIESGCKIHTYPVMDGVYFTAAHRTDIENALQNIFVSLGNMFIEEEKFNYQFLVKASVAYGPIIHGKDISDDINYQFAKNHPYKESLLLGLPMIQAYNGESSAPPFGIYIHESARAFHAQDESPFVVKWWKWFLCKRLDWDEEKTKRLGDKIINYFTNCRKQSLLLDYSESRIDSHEKIAKLYFELEK